MNTVPACKRELPHGFFVEATYVGNQEAFDPPAGSKRDSIRRLVRTASRTYATLHLA